MRVSDIEYKAASIIRKYLGESTPVYLFGSQAKGNARPASDIDIAVHVPRKSRQVFSRIKEEIDSLRTLRKIDLIDLALVSGKFRKHIFKYAVSL